MKKNVYKWVAIVIVALGVVGIVYVIWDHNRPSFLGNYTNLDTAVVETNPWKPYLSVSEKDTGIVIEVIWDQKYGATKKSYCMAVFQNEKTRQYRLIAPWMKNITIECQNMNDIKFNKVHRDSIVELIGVQ